MFGRIAARYDAANTVMTGGMDALWRARAARLVAAPRAGHVIDLCCGTGASTRALARYVPTGSVIGVDFSQPMLDVAQRRKLPNITYQQADVLQLPFPDATFDGASMAFSMRNVVDIGACLREVARVLKPGARFVNLEVNKPAQPLLRRLFFIYFYGLIPAVGGLVGGDAQAYRYLPQSLINFPSVDSLAELFRVNGFTNVRTAALMGGVAALHTGESRLAPAAQPASTYASAQPLSASPA